MRLAGLAGLMLGVASCKEDWLVTVEPSPAVVPARVVAAPGVSPALVDPAVFAVAVRAGVHQRDANEASYEVDAFLAALVVEDLASARPSLTLTPVVEVGLILGYQVSGVREGSVYAAIDLRDGDVIEAVNGVRLDGPERAPAALAGAERGVVLQVSRAGVLSAVELHITGGLAWSQVLVARGAVAPPPAPEALDQPILEDMPSAPAQPGSAGARQPAGAASPRPSGSQASAPASAPAPAASRASAVECTSDEACTVARRDFDAMVADPGALLRQVQVSEVKGGYRLSGIRPGTQVSALGFRNGDILIAVNGTRLDDQLGLLGLYGAIQSTRSYSVVYQRGGTRKTKTVRLRD